MEIWLRFISEFLGDSIISFLDENSQFDTCMGTQLPSYHVLFIGVDNGHLNLTEYKNPKLQNIELGTK